MDQPYQIPYFEWCPFCITKEKKNKWKFPLVLDQNGGKNETDIIFSIDW